MPDRGANDDDDDDEEEEEEEEDSWARVDAITETGCGI